MFEMQNWSVVAERKEHLVRLECSFHTPLYAQLTGFVHRFEMCIKNIKICVFVHELRSIQKYLNSLKMILFRILHLLCLFCSGNLMCWEPICIFSCLLAKQLRFVLWVGLLLSFSEMWGWSDDFFALERAGSTFIHSCSALFASSCCFF